MLDNQSHELVPKDKIITMHQAKKYNKAKLILIWDSIDVHIEIIELW